jgi:hypothetical protein
VLADCDEPERAAATLHALGAAYHPDLVKKVTSLMADLADDDQFANRLLADWDLDGLIPRLHYPGESDPKDLWGTAMAVLLATARLPASVRAQAVTELAALGRRDEAVRIARGMNREHRAAPELVAALARFLA